MEGHVRTYERRSKASRQDRPLVLSTKYMKLWSLSSIFAEAVKQPLSIISWAACIINSANVETLLFMSYMTLVGSTLNDQHRDRFSAGDFHTSGI